MYVFMSYVFVQIVAPGWVRMLVFLNGWRVQAYVLGSETYKRLNSNVACSVIPRPDQVCSC